jgi:hypothetical protein
VHESGRNKTKGCKFPCLHCFSFLLVLFYNSANVQHVTYLLRLEKISNPARRSSCQLFMLLITTYRCRCSFRFLGTAHSQSMFRRRQKVVKLTLKSVCLQCCCIMHCFHPASRRLQLSRRSKALESISFSSDLFHTLCQSCSVAGS